MLLFPFLIAKKRIYLICSPILSIDFFNRPIDKNYETNGLTHLPAHSLVFLMNNPYLCLKGMKQ